MLADLAYHWGHIVFFPILANVPYDGPVPFRQLAGTVGGGKEPGDLVIPQFGPLKEAVSVHLELLAFYFNLRHQSVSFRTLFGEGAALVSLAHPCAMYLPAIRKTAKHCKLPDDIQLNKLQTARNRVNRVSPTMGTQQQIAACAPGASAVLCRRSEFAPSLGSTPPGVI